MPARTREQLETDFADNSTGAITASTMRDLVSSIDLTAEADAKLAGKADATHAHALADVTGLETALASKADAAATTAALAGKAATSHAHALADVAGLETALAGKASLAGGNAFGGTQTFGGDIVMADASTLFMSGADYVASGGFVYMTGGSIYMNGGGGTGGGNVVMEGGSVTGANVVDATTLRQGGSSLDTILGSYATSSALAAGLAEKAATAHAHSLADVTGLETALAGKAPTAHAHAIADVTALQGALDGKAAAVHTHDDRYYTSGEVDGLLTNYSPTGHTHTAYALVSHTHDDRYYTETEITTLLAGKAATVHSHAIADVTSLQAELDAKASAAALGTHEADSQNPHATTAAQVGAYTIAQSDTALAAKLTTATIRNSVSVSTISAAYTHAANGFNTVPLDFRDVDNGNNFNVTTRIYTVPTSGTYEIVTKFRIADGVASGQSYGQGAGTTNADGSHFAWFVTAPNRNGSINTRIAQFFAGDQIRFYAYCDGFSPSIIKAEMDITLIVPNA